MSNRDEIDPVRNELLGRLRAAVRSEPDVAIFALGWLVADSTNQELDSLVEAVGEFSSRLDQVHMALLVERFGSHKGLR